MSDEKRPLMNVELTRRVGYFIDAYIRGFRRRFEQAPVITEDDKDAVRAFAQKWSGDKRAIDSLVDGYLGLNDDWLRQAGYPLKFLESRVNAVWASKPHQELEKTWYVVGFSESGVSVTSTNPNVLKDQPRQHFKPVPFDGWLAEKTFTGRTQNINWHLDTSDWEPLWEKLGFGFLNKKENVR